MKRMLAALAAAAATLAMATSAAADQPQVFGPFTYPIEFSFFACGFQADVSITETFENRIFSNPTFNIDYFRDDGTVSNPATGTTLAIRDSWTELGRPPASPDEGLGTFTQHGVTIHVLAPGAGVVLLKAGYVVYRYPDGFVFIQHGVDASGDLSALCAALAG